MAYAIKSRFLSRSRSRVLISTFWKGHLDSRDFLDLDLDSSRRRDHQAYILVKWFYLSNVFVTKIKLRDLYGPVFIWQQCTICLQINLRQKWFTSDFHQSAAESTSLVHFYSFTYRQRTFFFALKCPIYPRVLRMFPILRKFTGRTWSSNASPISQVFNFNL